MKQKDYQIRISRSDGFMLKNRIINEGYREIEGVVKTIYGLVDVFSHDGASPRTWISFISNGWECHRHFDKSYSIRYIVTLATRFAKEISEGSIQ